MRQHTNTDARDPEFDPPAPVDTSDCPIGRCEHGWVRVSDGYVDKHAPMPQLADPVNDAEQAMNDAIMREWRIHRAGVANSSYPCWECRPRQFARWQQGHWRPDHRIDECVECCLITGRNVPARKRRKAKEEPDATPDPQPSHESDAAPAAPAPRLDID